MDCRQLIDQIVQNRIYYHKESGGTLNEFARTETKDFCGRKHAPTTE